MHRSLDHIFLDMDGVMADFVSAVAKLHGRSDLLENRPPGERDIPKLLNLNRGIVITPSKTDWPLSASSWIKSSVPEVVDSLLEREYSER